MMLNKQNLTIPISLLSTTIIILLIGTIVLTTMSTEMPPSEFIITDKKIVEVPVGNAVFAWFGYTETQYRIYYNPTGYFPVDKNVYDQFNVGDWFNGTIIMLAY